MTTNNAPNVFDHVDLNRCRHDEAGNLAPCCGDAFAAGRLVGHTEGYAQAIADEDAAAWAAAQRVVHNVITDRSRSWEVAS